jgi:purine-binding chemotaxis protein CheW
MEKTNLAISQAHSEGKGGKYLTFNLDENVYGIPILKVSEIIGITSITPIPKTPAFIKGVINLRGKIIPVMDLRLKFDMSQREYDKNTCVIIINLVVKGLAKQIGVVVDIVSEVCSIPESEIEDPPSYGTDCDEGFISGVGKIKEKVAMLLDIEKVIFSHDILHLFKDKE